jgi:hypothetical protein
MNKEVRKYLIENVACFKGATIGYQVLCDQCQLGLKMKDSEYDRAEIGRIIGEISAFEHTNKRPLLSPLVTNKTTGYEGDGFYKLCEELGFGDWQKLKRERRKFDKEQKEKCWEFWGIENNRKKYTAV